MKILCEVLGSLPQLTGSKTSTFFTESYSEDKTGKNRRAYSDSTKQKAAVLQQKAVRSYMHVLCVVSLKPTRSLGDLHLVDKAEQSAKSEQYICAVNEQLFTP
jgi:hypothetical protein